jgi:hypothetical protein
MRLRCRCGDLEIGRDPSRFILETLAIQYRNVNGLPGLDVTHRPISCLMPSGSRNLFRTTPPFPSAPTSHLARTILVSPLLSLYSTTTVQGSSVRPMTSQPGRRSSEGSFVISSLNSRSYKKSIRSAMHSGPENVHVPRFGWNCEIAPGTLCSNQSGATSKFIKDGLIKFL